MPGRFRSPLLKEKPRRPYALARIWPPSAPGPSSSPTLAASSRNSLCILCAAGSGPCGSAARPHHDYRRRRHHRRRPALFRGRAGGPPPSRASSRLQGPDGRPLARGKNIRFRITYLDSFGRSWIGRKGFHLTIAGSELFHQDTAVPPRYWRDYPLYYSGDSAWPMRSRWKIPGPRRSRASGSTASKRSASSPAGPEKPAGASRPTGGLLRSSLSGAPSSRDLHRGRGRPSRHRLRADPPDHRRQGWRR